MRNLLTRGLAELGLISPEKYINPTKTIYDVNAKSAHTSLAGSAKSSSDTSANRAADTSAGRASDRSVDTSSDRAADKPSDRSVVDFNTYKGKVILIVNVASQCGFTHQYETLEKLNLKYKDQGLVILGFPCNQFGGQEPGTDADIASFCKINFGVTFPIFDKGLVKGPDKQSTFKFLTEEANSALNGEVMWNFEKFLINRSGHLVNRFRSIAKPDSSRFIGEIERLLAQ